MKPQAHPAWSQLAPQQPTPTGDRLHMLRTSLRLTRQRLSLALRGTLYLSEFTIKRLEHGRMLDSNTAVRLEVWLWRRVRRAMKAPAWPKFPIRGFAGHVPVVSDASRT